MKLNVNKLILGIIILIAIFFRVYNILDVPPQVTVDEISIGYNAYSILNTGADEYGSKFPILLRAYDDFRPALYVYLVIPFIKIFGLNALSIRLPAVILSILSVVSLYFLTRYLTKGAKNIKLNGIILDIPLVATFLFAISPWHIYISRLGHEANAAFAFLIFGLLFFYRFLNLKKWNLYISAMFFGLSFGSYQTTKIVVPLMLLVLFTLYFKKIVKEKSPVVISFLIGLAVITPIIFSSFDQNALIRFKGTNLIENSPQYFEKVFDRTVTDREDADLLGLIYDNRKFAIAQLYTQAYLSHIDPVWLFLNKGGESFKSPTMGLLYLIELPLILTFFLGITKLAMPVKSVIFILSWGALAIIPASITTGFPHAMRIYNLLPLPQIFAAGGLIILLTYINIKNYRILLMYLFLSLTVVSGLWFFHSYFTLLPRELSNHFQYGVTNALDQAYKIDGKYDRVIISNKDRLFESYMFYLYTKKYNPLEYQKTGGTISGGFAKEHKIGKYVFGKIDDKISKNTLYIINPSELTEGMDILSEIKYLNGELALIIAEIK